MPKFATLPPQQTPIAPGVYIGKIVSATEKVSEAGNDLISMRVMFPEGQSLACCLTFVPQARPVINAFCDSAELTKPAAADIEVELTSAHCKGRYIYVVVSNDLESNGEAAPRITQFLTREAALQANPALEKIALQPHEPVQLTVVPRTGNLFK
jgi:hypothetical protein